MRRPTAPAGLAALLLGVTLLLLAPGLAAARTSFIIPAGQSPRFTLKGSHGYTITISGSAGIFGGNNVTFSAKRGPRSAGYTTSTGQFSATTLRGGVGGFGGSGKVQVQFHQVGKAKFTSPDPGCKGPKNKVKSGFFRGTIRFTGEHGYTKLVAHRAKGTVVKSGDLTCTFSDGKSGTTTLSATKPLVGTSGITFTAIKPPAGSKVTFGASAYEDAGTTSIYRAVQATGPPNTFQHFGGLTTASLHPRRPFQGSAHLGSGAWSGSLSTTFPGMGRVRLTGSGFSVSMTKVP